MNGRRESAGFEPRVLVFSACVFSFVLGLIFIFVRAPHPWGWGGFDHYDDLGGALARGAPFPTIEWPWGYAWYLAAFYRAFGYRPAFPLTVQALLNALLPLLIYAFARVNFGDRIATTAAVLVGLFSFNTVYASTQSSDALCTVISIAAILAFDRAREYADWRRAALAGMLLGIAMQFRPNLALMPFVLAGFLIADRRNRGTESIEGHESGFGRALRQARAAAVLITAAGLVLLPWIVRNARLTGEFIPATTHGGVMLWYGTLQTGPYLKSHAYNPRRVFETGSFPYTSIDRKPLVVTARIAACAGRRPLGLALVYWTDRAADKVRVEIPPGPAAAVQADMAPAPAPTAYYFSFEALLPEGTARRVPDAASVYFVADDHLGDLDRHDDLLDVFDVIRLLRHLAWNEPITAHAQLDFDRDGRLTRADISAAIDLLLASSAHPAGTSVADIIADANAVRMQLADGSIFTVPHAWSNRITDVDVRGTLAEALLHSTVPFAALRGQNGSKPTGCIPVEDIAVNAVYYREQPHMMRRHLALALDNIRREPAAYLGSAAYRMLRVFFIEGSEDPNTTLQFAGSGRIYKLAEAASVGVLVMFAAGVRAAWRRGCDVALALVVIAYFPATLGFVLTTMRYSLTVQPLLFVFVAAALVSARDWVASGANRSAGPSPATPGSSPATPPRSRDRSEREYPAKEAARTDPTLR